MAVNNVSLVGTSGYDYAYWYQQPKPKGYDLPAFFPKGTTKAKALAYYSTQFNLLEVNNSYYRSPTVNACKKWYTSTPDHFRFLLKFPRAYTQYFKSIDEVFPPFLEAIKELKHKFEGILLQFSPNFIYKPQNVARLREAARVFAEHHIAIYIELRHKSWYEDAHFFDAVELFRELGWVFVNIHNAEGGAPDSVAKGWLPSELTITVPGKIMMRLHGTWSHANGPYSDAQLQDIAAQIKDIPHKIVTFNNTDSYEGQVMTYGVGDPRDQIMNYMKNYGWTEQDFLLYFLMIQSKPKVEFRDFILRPKRLDRFDFHCIKNAKKMYELIRVA